MTRDRDGDAARGEPAEYRADEFAVNGRYIAEDFIDEEAGGLSDERRRNIGSAALSAR